jgi:hypothetical protein
MPTLRVLIAQLAEATEPDASDKPLHCDMSKTCERPVAMIDADGYVYCAEHGAQRKSGGGRCRKLTTGEMKKLKQGKTISY